VITGDGEALMGMGSLATIGVKRPENLAIVVLDNGHYGETGMQASHTTGGVDLVAVAKACGFQDALTLTETNDIAHVRHLLHKGKGPLLVSAASRMPTPRACCRPATATRSSCASCRRRMRKAIP